MYKIRCKQNGRFAGTNHDIILWELSYFRNSYNSDTERILSAVTVTPPYGQVYVLKRSAQALCRRYNKKAAVDLGMYDVFEVVEFKEEEV
jgi:hypothetical protein